MCLRENWRFGNAGRWCRGFDCRQSSNPPTFISINTNHIVDKVIISLAAHVHFALEIAACSSKRRKCINTAAIQKPPSPHNKRAICHERSGSYCEFACAPAEDPTAARRQPSNHGYARTNGRRLNCGRSFADNVARQPRRCG